MLTGQLLLQGKAPKGPGASTNILPCLPGSGNFSLQWDPALHGRRARCGQRVEGLPGAPIPHWSPNTAPCTLSLEAQWAMGWWVRVSF